MERLKSRDKFKPHRSRCAGSVPLTAYMKQAAVLGPVTACKISNLITCIIMLGKDLEEGILAIQMYSAPALFGAAAPRRRLD